MARRIAINGMGRIGRTLFKILLGRDDLELVAINDLRPIDELIKRLADDGFGGSVQANIKTGQEGLEIDGRLIRKYGEKDPENLPWKLNEIDLVFECTGVFTARPDLEKHIQAGAGHVILSAHGGENDIMTVVYGANDLDISEKVLSCGSGSTNCISPVMEIIDRRLGIHKAVTTTARSCNGSSHDGPTTENESHERPGPGDDLTRRPENEPAITGVLPELGGLYDGVVFNGGSPKGYLADIVICAIKSTTAQEVNAILAEEAAGNRYNDVLGVSSSTAEPGDFGINSKASLVDLNMTRVVGGDLIKIVSWYDNEWGYGHQMVRTAEQLLNMQQETV